MTFLQDIKDAPNSVATQCEEALASRERAAGTARVVPVVLAGGAGTRLWPLSREEHPKQLIDVLGKETLLQSTLSRLQGFDKDFAYVDAPIVVCGAEHKFSTHEQLSTHDAKSCIIVEPARRDTAPALTLAAAQIVQDGDDAIIVAMPADHAILDTVAFQKAINIAVRQAATGKIVTLGIPPTHAETGLGYIELGAPISDGVYNVASFVEKPHAQLAAQYFSSNKYWWNSGIFVVSASLWLKIIQSLEPEIYKACVLACAQGVTNGDAIFPAKDHFIQSPSISIDYAVMERLSSAAGVASGVVVLMDAGWSDLGSWDAVWEAATKDANGNVAQGRIVFEGTTSSIAHSEGRLIACVGVSNVVVVETPDAILVADRSHAQDVKKVVERIRRENAPEARSHRKVKRPWGYYDSIDRGDRFQVKRIVVQPGGCLSLQLHYHRAEHWIVVSGTARVTRGDEQFMLAENESTFIPVGTVHRLENPGRVPLEMIEVQSGSYLGEDDIVRFEDTYGRS